MSKKITTEIFINKAHSVHMSIYDYSIVNYVNSYSKIKIICNKHGIFEQTPNNHLNGNGCPNCIKNKKTNTIDFIEKSKIIHGNKYDYDLVKYCGSHINVNIVCKTHGIFKQTPTNHLSGNGCPDCGYVNNSKYFMFTNNEFINKAKLIHNDKYDYSLTKYNGWNNKIIIICEKHGEFKQGAGAHLCGKGCNLCNESKGELIIKKYLDKNNIKYIREKIFELCKNKKYLPFDFYLPEQNLLIEYDGLQHFKSINYWGGDAGFNLRQNNDNIKNNFAKNNNIGLLRIKYNKINNINQILCKTIN